MKIVRTINGVEETITLTEREMREAYHIQLRKNYLSNIAFAIEQINDGPENIIDEDFVLADHDVCNEIIHIYEEYTYTEDGNRWYEIVSAVLERESYL